MEKIYLKYLFIIPIVFLSFRTISYTTNKKLELPTVEISVDYYEEVVNQVKIIEGFSSSWYKCAGGKATIGYGITQGKYKEIDKLNFIDSTTAEEYLKLEFDRCLNIAQKDGLYGNKALAIASFIYNVGEGNYRKSKLRKLILRNKSIDKEIMRWVYAKGKFLRGLQKRREYELKIFKDE